MTVKFLLEHGASIDGLSTCVLVFVMATLTDLHPNSKGESAIFFAARMGHTGTFRLLLESVRLGCTRTLIVSIRVPTSAFMACTVPSWRCAVSRRTKRRSLPLSPNCAELHRCNP